MLKCDKCGFENKDNATFCINCGERFDGISLCPYCHKEIQNTDRNCPHCNKSLGKESLDPLNEEEDRRKTKREKVNPIFERVFIIVGIVLFALSFGLVFVNFYSIGDDKFNIITLLFYNWSMPNNGAETINFVHHILVATFLVINWIFTYIIASIGIFRSVKELKKEAPFTYQGAKFIGFILLSNLFTLFVTMSNAKFIDNFNAYVVADGSYISAFSNLLLYVALAMVYRTYYSFKKGRFSRLIEKVLFSFFIYGFALLVLFLAFPSVLTFKENADGNVGIFSAISSFSYLEDYLVNVSLETSRASFILEIVSFAFIFIGLLLFMTLGFIFLQFYFGKIEEQKSFKIPFFSASIFVSVTIFIGFICHLVSLYTSPYSDLFIFVFPLSIVMAVFPLALIVFTLVPSLILTRRNILIDKLLNKNKEN